MIEQQATFPNGHRFHVVCDSCGENMDVTFDSFHDAVAEVKRSEWKLTKYHGEWAHFCPECKDDFKADKG